jgi:hypothetical protein
VAHPAGRRRPGRRPNRDEREDDSWKTSTITARASLADAVKLLKDSPDAKLLSGGMTIIPTMKQRLATPERRHRPRRLAAVGRHGAGRTLTIQAGTTHADVAANETVRKTIPALADLAAHIGDPHVRNRGTIGGSVANNDPAADYPAALVALKATVVTDRREIAAEEFFTGMFETALADDEIITAVRFAGTQARRLRQVPQPGLALCHGGRVRGRLRLWRGPRGGDRGRRQGVPGRGHGAGAGERLQRASHRRHHRAGRPAASATCTPPPSTAPTSSTSWPNAPSPRRDKGRPPVILRRAEGETGGPSTHSRLM